MLMIFSSWLLCMSAEMAVLLNVCAVHYGPRNESLELLARRQTASSCNALQLPPFLVICFHVYVMV